MRYASLVFTLCTVAFLSACAGVRVSQDYDVASDFSRFKTFGWANAVQPKTGDVRVDNPLLDTRIRKAVEQTLIGKGLRQAEKQTSDLTVAYRLLVQSKIGSSPVSIGVGTGFGIGSGSFGGVGVGTSTVDSYDEGILIIDFTDATNGNLIWRGTGAKRLPKSPDPQKTTQEVNVLVENILAQYPPSVKK